MDSKINTMEGLRHNLNQAKDNPCTLTLGIGLDLTSLGLEVQLGKHSQPLYQKFTGPWNEEPSRLHDLEDSKIPDFYYTNISIREKLPQVEMTSQTLYDRNWRFHKVEKQWISRQQTISVQREQVLEASGSRERNLWVIFDPILWKKTIKEMSVVYEELMPRVNQNELEPFLKANGLSQTTLN